MAAQKPTDPFGSMAYEIRAGLRRFWGLSWWWKGSILGVIAAVIVVPGLVIALAGGNGDDSAVLELTQEPTPTVAVATPTPTPTPTPTSTPTPTPTPRDESREYYPWYREAIPLVENRGAGSARADIRGRER